MMKMELKQISIVACIVLATLYTPIPVFAQMMMGDTLHLGRRGEKKITRAVAQERFRQELEQLRTLAPDALRHIASDQMVAEMSLFAEGGEALLFAAADTAQQNVDVFYRKFPILAAVAELKYIGDLDQDGSNELVGCLEYESAAIHVYVFKREGTQATRYTYNMEAAFGDNLSISDVRTSFAGDVVIVGQSRSMGHLPVKGQKRSVDYECVYEMEVKFTGTTFEIVTPMKQISQELILDN